jgi:peptide deformylase
VTIRKITPIGHPILRAATRDISTEELASPEVQQLIDDMIDTMRDAAGAGIAANQVYSDLRIGIVEVTDNPRYPYKPSIALTVIVNPVWEPLDDERFDTNEGCLSVPLRGDLQRWTNIRVSYVDRHGEPHEEIRHGLTAGTFQHEIDHLDGRMIVDHIDPRTLSTWDQFDQHHRDEFVQRITAFVERVGS